MACGDTDLLRATLVMKTFRIPFGLKQLNAPCVAATVLLALIALPSPQAFAQSEDLSALTNYSLEDLLTLESTSVAKKRQSVEDSAAAVFIITNDDIRRSGATSIPEALRMVPGVMVSQIANNASAVAVRGGSTRFANGLLVMVDGRSLYVTTLSGVLWDQHIPPLSEIERIEVVRGPGATMWGSNAVNGVINVITKSSLDSQGLSVSGIVGTLEKSATLRFGGQAGENLTWRVYATGELTENFEMVDGSDLPGSGETGQLGFRMDYAASADDQITVQGDLVMGNYTDSPILLIPPAVPEPSFAPLDGKFSGQNILARWASRLSDDKEITLQGYFDRTKRQEFGADIRRNLLDVDFSLQWDANERHEFVFGVGAQGVWEYVDAQNEIVSFAIDRRNDQWISGFVQDDIWLVPSKLRLSLGTKLEYNTLTGVEFQPSVRLLYKPVSGIGLWASYAKANRTPASFEELATVTLPTPPVQQSNFGQGLLSSLPIFSTLIGSDDLGSVLNHSFEAGIRAALPKGWSVDIAAYYNLTRRVIAYELVGQGINGFLPTAILTTSQISNSGETEGWGLELAASGRWTPSWQTKFAYSFFGEKFNLAPGAVALAGEGVSPKHQISLQNQFDINEKLKLDVWLRHVSKLALVPSYQDLDVRLNYEVNYALELSVVGQNLLERRRPEFAQPAYPGPVNQIPRAVYGAVTLRY